MSEWWRGLHARERRTLVVAGGALVAMLFYFLLWLPPHQAIEAQRERLRDLREDAAWMRDAVAAYQRLGGSADGAPAQSGQALYALADRTAREAGLGEAIERVEPSGETRVRVSFQGATFDELVRWLGRLEREFGISAAPVSLRRGDDAGRVDARLTLSREGA